MTVFYNIYCELCAKKGKTPSGVASEIGFNRSTITMWRNSGSAPRKELLIKIANYFGVSTDYLLEKAENKKSPDFSELSGVYLSFAQNAQDNGIDPADIQMAIDMIRRLKNKEKE